MLKLIVGLKGTGKTKNLISLVNAATESSNGSVICIEKGDKLNFDISHKVRLIDAQAYFIDDASALYGFIAGIMASNHDITDIFIDSALKIAGDDVPSFEGFLTAVNGLSEKFSFRCIMTASIDDSDCTELMKKFI